MIAWKQHLIVFSRFVLGVSGWSGWFTFVKQLRVYVDAEHRMKKGTAFDFADWVNWYSYEVRPDKWTPVQWSQPWLRTLPSNKTALIVAFLPVTFWRAFHVERINLSSLRKICHIWGEEWSGRLEMLSFAFPTFSEHDDVDYFLFWTTCFIVLFNYVWNRVFFS